MKRVIFALGVQLFFACSKTEVPATTPKPSTPVTTFPAPTVSISGLDSLKVGDSTNLSFSLTGSAPFKLVYTDGTSNFTVDNITTTSYSVYIKPSKSIIYKPVSISDKNLVGTVSGEYNIWVQPQFISKAPTYSNINNTTGNINNNIKFRGGYYHIDEINAKFTFTITDNKNGTSKYQMSDHSYVFFDYNNDGYLDLFGWLYNLTPIMGRKDGKYVLIENVNSSKRKFSFYDSDIAWPSGMELNDFNNDGIKDVVFYSYNNHNDIGGQANNTAKSVKVFLFDKTGTFKEVNATLPLIVHDMASGDINNDGYVDLLVWEYGGAGGIYKPRLYLNNVQGSFTESGTANIIGLQDILDTRSSGIVALATELIDLNGDGNLDIIFSTTIGGVEFDYLYHNNSALYKLTQQRILWGSGNGRFDLKTNYTDLPNSIIEQWSRTQPVANDSVFMYNKNEKLALGFNFLDFNNDGKLDVITAITPHYAGYMLQAHQNMGNNTFKDVTSEIIGNYNGLLNGTNNAGLNGDIPNFYEIRPYDIDNDGDFDLVPHGVACWESYTYPKYVYWENVGGKFILRK